MPGRCRCQAPRGYVLVLGRLDTFRKCGLARSEVFGRGKVGYSACDKTDGGLKSCLPVPGVQGSLVLNSSLEGRCRCLQDRLIVTGTQVALTVN